MTRCRKIPLEIYPTDVYAVMGDRLADALPEVRRITGERITIKEIRHWNGGFFAGKYGVVMVFQKTENIERIIVHECTHAAVFILENAGVPLTMESSEALCYLVDYLFSEAYAFCQGQAVTSA